MFKMLETVKMLLLSGSLSVFAWVDHKKQKVYLTPLLGTGIAGLLLHLCEQGKSVWDLLAGAAVGALLLLYGKITGESVGYGDGVLFMVTGVFLGFWKNIELLMAASFLAACYAGVLIFVKKKTKQECFPFVPFVWVSSILLWFW